MTERLKLSKKAINNLNLKVSADIIGLSYENDIVVYEGVIGDTPVRVARCTPLGERDNFNMVRIFTNNCYMTVALEILEDESFIIEYIKQSIDRSKKFNP